MVEAACLPTAWLTAYRMLFVRGGLRPGESVLVQGVGGGVSTALHPDTGLPTVVVYDGFPGGAGIAERGPPSGLGDGPGRRRRAPIPRRADGGLGRRRGRRDGGAAALSPRRPAQRPGRTVCAGRGRGAPGQGRPGRQHRHLSGPGQLGRRRPDRLCPAPEPRPEAAGPAAGADRLRHSRRRAGDMEQLEGGTVAQAAPADGGRAGERPGGRQPRAAGGRGPAQPATRQAGFHGSGTGR